MCFQQLNKSKKFSQISPIDTTSLSKALYM